MKDQKGFSNIIFLLIGVAIFTASVTFGVAKYGNIITATLLGGLNHQKGTEIENQEEGEVLASKTISIEDLKREIEELKKESLKPETIIYKEIIKEVSAPSFGKGGPEAAPKENNSSGNGSIKKYCINDYCFKNEAEKNNFIYNKNQQYIKIIDSLISGAKIIHDFALYVKDIFGYLVSSSDKRYLTFVFKWSESFKNRADEIEALIMGLEDFKLGYLKTRSNEVLSRAEENDFIYEINRLNEELEFAFQIMCNDYKIASEYIKSIRSSDFSSRVYYDYQDKINELQTRFSLEDIANSLDGIDTTLRNWHYGY